MHQRLPLLQQPIQVSQVSTEILDFALITKSDKQYPIKNSTDTYALMRFFHQTEDPLFST